MSRWVVLSLLAACTAGGGSVSRVEHGERQEITRSTVPVLVPRSLDLARAGFVVEKTYTAMSLPLEGATVALHATRIAHRYPGVRPDPGLREVRGRPAHVTRNENIHTVSWVEPESSPGRGTVAYALTLECATAGDPRCADDRTLLAIAAELTEVGP